MAIRKLVKFLITALAVVSVVAHPKLSDSEVEEYGQHIKSTTQSIGRCLEVSPELKIRMNEKRDAMLVHNRKARDIAVPKGLEARTFKPNKEALLKWNNKPHNHPLGESSDPQNLFDFNWEDTPTAHPGGCALAPETIYGPYWLDGQPERQNINPGKPGKSGIYNRIALQVIDVNNCMPMSGARVDIWHADAMGRYDPKVDGALRGWQRTSVQGTVDFDSIFPGHYPGRAHHIHVAVRPGSDQHMAHVGMIYYDQSLRDFVDTNYQYLDNPDKNPVSNADDSIAQLSASTEYDPFFQYSWFGNMPDSGILTWIVIGVNNSDSTIQQPPKPAAGRSLFDAHLE